MQLLTGDSISELVSSVQLPDGNVLPADTVLPGGYQIIGTSELPTAILSNVNLDLLKLLKDRMKKIVQWFPQNKKRIHVQKYRWMQKILYWQNKM